MLWVKGSIENPAIIVMLVGGISSQRKLPFLPFNVVYANFTDWSVTLENQHCMGGVGEERGGIRVYCVSMFQLCDKDSKLKLF